MKKFYLVVGLWATLFSMNAQNVADFENIQLDSASWWNGADGAGGFTSGGFYFPNNYNFDWGSWSGFSVSNMKDSLTAGWENQYSAITAGGAEQSDNYAVVYVSGEQQIDFDAPLQIGGFFATNATYTYLSMKYGDDFTKKFGGADGTDPDYFKLIVSGYETFGDKTDSVDFFLADFRYNESEKDYIVNDWKWIDLSTLGVVSSIKLKLESTDNGDWGMNTPAYFCIDNFTGSVSVSAGLKEEIKLNIYPNPINEYIQIECSSLIHNLNLVDCSGKTVFQRSAINQYNFQISGLSDLPHGIYLLNLGTKEDTFQQKIIK